MGPGDYNGLFLNEAPMSSADWTSVPPGHLPSMPAEGNESALNSWESAWIDLGGEG
jgi:hypothetical protein